MPLPSLRLALVLSLLGASAACRSNDRTSTADTATGAAPVASATPRDPATATASGMGATMGGMHEDTLAARVQAHLARLSTTNPDSLRALLPADRETVTTLIADCEQMMRQMKMDPPRKWRNAARDLRQDLDRMKSMSGAQLRQAMTEHRTRIEGMLAMRHDMMRM